MNENVKFLIVVFPVLILAVAAISVQAHWRLRPYYATLQALSNRFPGSLSKGYRYLLHQPSFIGTFSGYNFSVTYVANRVCVYELVIACDFCSLNKLKIFMYDKNPTHVFLAERIEIGDRSFDKYFIYSNMPDEAKRYFTDESKRDNIKQLISNGWNLPIISGGRLYISLSDHRPSPFLHPAVVEATLVNLIALRVANR